MQTDDLILVSIDDHVVEPPDMFLRHVPAKYKDEAPVVVTDDKGVDQWMYQGRPQGVSGLNAVVSWPAEEWGRDPAGFAEMRPGVYDVHSPRIPDVPELRDRLRAILEVLEPRRVWVNPDCGLKTRRPEEAWPALEHMVAAARDVRETMLAAE